MPVGSMPTTVMAPTMCGRNVPRSPSEPETSPVFQANRDRVNLGGSQSACPCPRTLMSRKVRALRGTLSPRCPSVRARVLSDGSSSVVMPNYASSRLNRKLARTHIIDAVAWIKKNAPRGEPSHFSGSRGAELQCECLLRVGTGLPVRSPPRPTGGSR